MHTNETSIDSIILDLILEHFNVQALSGKKELLTGREFQAICDIAEAMYIKEAIFEEQAGIA
jgi:hypothetical protein